MFALATALSLAAAPFFQLPASWVAVGEDVERGGSYVSVGETTRDGVVSELKEVLSRGTAEHFSCADRVMDAEVCVIRMAQDTQLVSLMTNLPTAGDWSLVFKGQAATELNALLAGAEPSVDMHGLFNTSASKLIMCVPEQNMCVINNFRHPAIEMDAE